MPKRQKLDGEAGRTRRGQIRQPWKIPKWLPKVVADLSVAIATDGYLPLQLTPALRLRLKRVTTDSRMEFVWRQLAREIANVARGQGPFQIHKDHISTFADVSLRGYLIAAMVADSRAAYWRSAPSTEQRRELMRNIRDRASELRSLLGNPLDFQKWTAWDQLSAACRGGYSEDTSLREVLNYLALQTYGRYWSRGDSTVPKFVGDLAEPTARPFPLEARMLLGDLRSQLMALERLSTLSLDTARTKFRSPYKTKQLRQAIYVRGISDYAKGQGLRPRQWRGLQAGFPLHQIVAITANVALELSVQDSLTPGTVRKVVATTSTLSA